jgi:hypothetical protein
MARLVTPIPLKPQQNQTKDASICTESPRLHSPQSDTLPSLTTEIATSEAEITQALKLVADSVAQQRQLAATAVVFHWRSWVIMAAGFVYAYYVFYKDQPDWSQICMTCTMILTIGLLFICAWTGGYIQEAQRVGTLKWLVDDDLSPNVAAISGVSECTTPDRRRRLLNGSDEGMDIVLVTKFGKRVIATVILRIVKNIEDVKLRSAEKKGTISNANKWKPQSALRSTTFVRAWTVEQRYRGVGVGAAILKDAVALCYEANILPLVFSDLHANSLRVLSDLYNCKMNLDSDRAREYLGRLLVESSEQFEHGAPLTSLRIQFDQQIAAQQHNCSL